MDENKKVKQKLGEARNSQPPFLFKISPVKTEKTKTSSITQIDAAMGIENLFPTPPEAHRKEWEKVLSLFCD